MAGPALQRAHAGQESRIYAGCDRVAGAGDWSQHRHIHAHQWRAAGPVPVRAPQELVSFGKAFAGGVLGGVDMGTADLYPYDFARQMEKQPGPFEGIFAYNSRMRNVGVQPGEHPIGQATQELVHLVSGNYFGVLGVPMFMGRSIQPSDAEAQGRNAVVVVSYHYWRETMDADPAAIGRTVTINGVPCTVVGVASAQILQHCAAH